MKLIDRPVTELREAADNPRLIDEQAVATVAGSIRRYGFRIPILATEDGEVICGHVRLRAARELDMPTVPCIAAADMTPAQVKEFRLIENRTHDLGGEWDLDALARQIPDMPDVGEWFADVDLPAPDVDAPPPPDFSAEDAPGSDSPPGVGVYPPNGQPNAVQPDSASPDPDPVVFLAVRVRRSGYAELKRQIEEFLGRGVSEPDGPAVTPGPDGMQD